MGTNEQYIKNNPIENSVYVQPKSEEDDRSKTQVKRTSSSPAAANPINPQATTPPAQQQQQQQQQQQPQLTLLKADSAPQTSPSDMTERHKRGPMKEIPTEDISVSQCKNNRKKKLRRRQAEITQTTEQDDMVFMPQKTLEEGEGKAMSDKGDSKKEFEDLEKKLREFDFYHGFLPREDLPTVLNNKGDYLLRVSEVHEGEQKVKREVILSLIPVGNDRSSKRNEKTQKPHRNVIIKRHGSLFFIEPAHPFENVKDLLNYYKTNKGTCNAITFQLKNPVLIQSWEFMHSDVVIGKVLGEGAFGKVCAGALKLKDNSIVEVAVKMTKATAFLSKAKIREMMNEARFIRNFNHKNVVRLYGVAHDEQPLYILLELVKGGSLKSYLAKTKTTLVEKLKHCIGSARGIEYLHQNKCIHRDIAARNCLLSEGVIKITDFGLSRTGPSYKLKTSCKLPTRWLAPEVLTTLTFSYGSDVYSYAIMCYEILTDGGEPFENRSNGVVKADVLAGRYLQMPPNCPEPIKRFISTKIFVENSKRATMTETAIEVEKVTADVEKAENSRFNISKNFKNLKRIF